VAKVTWWQKVKNLTARDVPAPVAVFFPALPPDQRECSCGAVVTIWRTYPDGRIFCVPCGERLEARGEL
jgi:hypothetical protein